MKHFKWQVILSAFLVILSAILYYLHFHIFRDAHHIFIYMLGDIAFVPIEVLLVTIIIHRLLNIREKRSTLEKLNMVIGAFFSEAGTRLLDCFSRADDNVEKIKEKLIVSSGWSDRQFLAANKRLKRYKYEIDIEKIDLRSLRDLLYDKRGFMLRLLENPALLEQQPFTDLLRATFHLAEELTSRNDLGGLPDSDMKHLAGDTNRVYGLLVGRWLDYMHYLKRNYPYLFSLAIRTNPFDKDASVVVK
ncbi:hypothetical protein ACFL96_04745 [Thermoproteota archaeon]